MKPVQEKQNNTQTGSSLRRRCAIKVRYTKLVFLFALLIAAQTGNEVCGQATHFVAILGNTMYNEGIATLVLNDSVYLVIGNSAGFQNNGAIWMGWIDNQGNLLKDKMISRYWGITASAVTSTDSTIHIAGHAYKEQRYQHMVLRINMRGEVLTECYWGGPGWRFLHGITVTSNQNIYVAGSTTDTLYGTTSGMVAALDSSGTLLWEKHFGGSHNDIFLTIDTGHAQTLIMGGITRSFSLTSDSALWIIKTNLGGDLIWEFIKEHTGPEQVTDLLASTSGGYIACGITFNNTINNNQAFLLYLDEFGTEQWFNPMLGGASENGYRHVIQLSDSTYRMAGYYAGQYAAGGRDLFFINADNNGFWMPASGGIIKGGKNDDIAYHVATTPDNGFVITGTTRSYGPGISHIMVLKTDSIASNSPTLPHQTNIPNRTHESKNTALKAWPIPASDMLNIRLKETTAFQRDVKVTITDLSGRTIVCEPVSHSPGDTITIPIAGISPGIYLLQIDNSKLIINIK
jgi:hypothetical protein